MHTLHNSISILFRFCSEGYLSSPFFCQRPRWMSKKPTLSDQGSSRKMQMYLNHKLWSQIKDFEKLRCDVKMEGSLWRWVDIGKIFCSLSLRALLVVRSRVIRGNILSAPPSQTTISHLTTTTTTTTTTTKYSLDVKCIQFVAARAKKLFVFL